MSALIGYGRPDDGTWAIDDTSVGAAFDTDSAALSNTVVADRTAIQWLSGSQTTSSVLKLQYSWSVAQPVRIIPILDLKNIPEGTKIIVTGQRLSDPSDSNGGTFPYALGGNSATVRTFTFADGSVGAWVICDAANSDLVGIQVAIYNDVNGAASIVADSFVYIGEIDAFQAVDVKVTEYNGWQVSFAGLPNTLRSTNNQARRLAAKPYRIQTVGSIPVTFDTAFGVSGFTVIDYDKLVNICVAGDAMVVIPQYEVNGAFDSYVTHRTAVYGTAGNLSPPQYDQAGYYRASFEVEEIPAQGLT